jgi:heme O synthase-like polyprenyltransferase
MVKLLKASYLVSKRIAMAAEACTVVENRIKPCILDVVCAVLNKASAQTINNAVDCPIDDDYNVVISYVFNPMNQQMWQG